MSAILKSLPYLTILAIIILIKFIYIDLDNNCFITTIPTFLPGNLNSKDAVKIIKLSSPEEYSRLCNNVRFINKNPSCGGYDGGCYSEDNKNSIYIGNDQSNPAMAAAIIVHEVCHVMQRVENRGYEEGECYKRGSDFIKEITIYKLLQ